MTATLKTSKSNYNGAFCFQDPYFPPVLTRILGISEKPIGKPSIYLCLSYWHFTTQHIEPFSIRTTFLRRQMVTHSTR